MQPDKIRLGNDSGYVAGTLDGARFNGTPHKEEFAHVAQAPAAAAAPFDLSSCCSADEDDGYNYCTCVGFAQSLLLTCWVCVCDLVENIKGCFACLWYTQEESQVSTFINTWDKRVVPKEGEPGYEEVRAEWERGFVSFCPRSLNDFNSLTAAEYAERDFAQQNFDQVYAHRLEEESPFWWSFTVRDVIYKSPGNQTVLTALKIWLAATPEDRKVNTVVDDLQITTQFVQMWEGGETQIPLWKRSYDCLPDAVKQTARSAFVSAHPELHDQIPRRYWPPTMSTEQQAIDGAKRYARTKDEIIDGLIYGHVNDPAVVKAVREWKPEEPKAPEAAVKGDEKRPE